ncbi:UNVERIFIED_CONTAM: hypothetical protein Scaly_1030500 [Sesamum calycinum]|uniref:Endonuclease/exonuclease/phosphatase domain-containing protein n=1 Tax=Sesamum calycinum TaxID=2727403 RepID=A0AAW2QK91_9LAMI
MAQRSIWSFMRFVVEQASPLVIGDDFNLVVSVSEWSNGVFPTHHSVEEFSEAIFDYGLVDVGFQENQFTWTNHRLWQRLDRICFSSEWIDGCPNTLVRHLPHCGSDHCLLLILSQPQALTMPSSFRFQNIWCRHSGFLQVVKDCWELSVQQTGFA